MVGSTTQPAPKNAASATPTRRRSPPPPPRIGMRSRFRARLSAKIKGPASPEASLAALVMAVSKSARKLRDADMYMVCAQ